MKHFSDPPFGSVADAAQFTMENPSSKPTQGRRAGRELNYISTSPRNWTL